MTLRRPALWKRAENLQSWRIDCLNARIGYYSLLNPSAALKEHLMSGSRSGSKSNIVRSGLHAAAAGAALNPAFSSASPESLPVSSELSSELGSYKTDWVGIGLSWGCLLHCLVLPFLIPVVPLAFHFVEEWLHPLVSAGMISAAAWAFFRGYRIHHSKPVLLMGILGCLLVILPVILESAGIPAHEIGSVERIENYWHVGSRFLLEPELILSALGSVLLIVAHLRNIAHCRCRPLSGDACGC